MWDECDAVPRHLDEESYHCNISSWFVIYETTPVSRRFVIRLINNVSAIYSPDSRDVRFIAVLAQETLKVNTSRRLKAELKTETHWIENYKNKRELAQVQLDFRSMLSSFIFAVWFYMQRLVQCSWKVSAICLCRLNVWFAFSFWRSSRFRFLSSSLKVNRDDLRRRREISGACSCF